MIARAVDGARDGTLLKSHKVATAAVSTLEEAITTGILSALVEQANEVRAVLDAEHVRLTKVVR